MDSDSVLADPNATTNEMAAPASGNLMSGTSQDQHAPASQLGPSDTISANPSSLSALNSQAASPGSPPDAGLTPSALDNLDLSGYSSANISNLDTPADANSPDLSSSADAMSPPESSVNSSGKRSRSVSPDTSGSKRPKHNNHKATDDVMEQAMQDPDLFGLRRTGRARQPPKISVTTPPTGSKNPRKRTSSGNENGETDFEDGQDSDSDDDEPVKKRRKPAPAKAVRKTTAPPSYNTSVRNSDSEEYGSARNKIVTKKARRKNNANLDALLGDVRFSTRKSTRITTYNEDDDDDADLLEDDDYNQQLQNTYGDSSHEEGPGIDAILNHRPVDQKTLSPDADEHDFEYLIKWKGQSHYHATWMSWNELRENDYNGKRSENYFKKFVLDYIDYVAGEDVSPEQREEYLIKFEERAAGIAQHSRVERVVDARTNRQTGGEYFVKWHGIHYDECTWESRELIMELAPEKIDQFEDRCNQDYSSDKRESNPNTRKPMRRITKQPDYIVGGELRQFQLGGLDFLLQNWSLGRNTILADEMGLGKTVQSVSYISVLVHERDQAGPFLVVAPLSTIPAWAETFNHWAPDINYVVYNGNAKARATICEKEVFVNGYHGKTKINVLVTTPEMARHTQRWQPLSGIKWQCLIVDEAHSLKDPKSTFYRALMNESFTDRLLITGTPIQNNFLELAALMSFLMPGHEIFDGYIDLAADTASTDIEKLQQDITPYMLRRTKIKVEKDLPKKTEKIIRVPTAEVQLELYKNLLSKNYTVLKHKMVIGNNLHAELRKASNHPLLFPHMYDEISEQFPNQSDWARAIVSTSGKMYVVEKLLKKLQAEGHRTLIFSQSVKMLDILADYLSLKGTRFQRLDGTIPAGPRQKAIEHFNAPGSEDTCFLLSTRAGGLGINLMTADTVILYDSDYNPQSDLQAMSRAHRIGQKKDVTVFRLIAANTVDEDVVQSARGKLIIEHITIQQGISDKDPRIARVKQLAQAPNEKSNVDDIDRALRARGQKLFEQRDSTKELENMDIDAVLENAEIDKTAQMESLAVNDREDFLNSFELLDVNVNWDEIIPKERIEAAEAEERRLAEEKATQELIAQNAPRNRKPAKAAASSMRGPKAPAMYTESDEEDNEPDENPKRPLTSREWGRLQAAYNKYGFLEDKLEDVVREAKLIGRDSDMLKSTFNGMYNIGQQKVKEELESREAAARDAGRKLKQAESKTAIKFEHNGLQVSNAKKFIDRGHDLRTLRDAIKSVETDLDFRMPVEPIVKVHFTVDWDIINDSMLLVGVSRHGHSNWEAIKFDPELGLKDKIFLESAVDKAEAGKGHGHNVKSPGPMHLTRRVDYLVLLLKSHFSNGTDESLEKQLQNYHRNLKKDPATIAKEKEEALAKKEKEQTSIKKKDPSRQRAGSSTRPAATATPPIHKKSPAAKKPANGTSSEPTMEQFFAKPAKELNEWESTTTKDPVETTKKMQAMVKILHSHIEEGKGANGSEDFKTRCWEYSAKTWFKAGAGAALRGMAAKLAAKAKASGSPSAKANGHTSQPSKKRSSETIDDTDHERRKRQQLSTPTEKNGHASDRPRKTGGSSTLRKGPNLTADSFKYFGGSLGSGYRPAER